MGKEQIFLQGQVMQNDGRFTGKMHYKGYIYVILEVILKVKNLPKVT